MSFLLDPPEEELDDPACVTRRFAAYREYLERVRGELAPNAYAFAVAGWHYSLSDRRSPHDAWLESLLIQETAGQNSVTERSTEIVVRLLGPYHDGRITLRYVGVRSYSMSYSSWTERGQLNHGDWVIDEVRLAQSGCVAHEIVFDSDARWLIECDDIVYSWEDFPTEDQKA